MHNWTDSQVRGITRRIEHNHTIPMFDQLIKIGIPPKYAQIAIEQYKSPKEPFNFNESIFLTGKSGAGKTITSIMWIIFHFEQWRRNLENWNPDKEAIFIKEIDILESIKNSYSKPNVIDDDGKTFTASEIIVNRYKDVALLVIDDFGVDKTSDWSYSMLYSILCHRYEWEKQTIFSSNYSLNEISKKLGDVRITNRIADWCRVIQMSGDFRKK